MTRDILVILLCCFLDFCNRRCSVYVVFVAHSSTKLHSSIENLAFYYESTFVAQNPGDFETKIKVHTFTEYSLRIIFLNCFCIYCLTYIKCCSTRKLHQVIPETVDNSCSSSSTYRTFHASYWGET